MVNPSEVLRPRKTMLDYDMLQAQFDMMKQAKRAQMIASMPSTIRIANEIESALQSGDIERANLLQQVHKTFDRGIIPYGVPQYAISPTSPSLPDMSGLPQIQAPIDAGRSDPPGLDMSVNNIPEAMPTHIPPVSLQPMVIPGYGQAVGSIAAQKKGMETQAQKDVQLKMDPEIARKKAEQSEIGKAGGEKEVAFTESASRIPQLKNLVTRLSHLGNAATYTMTGQARDTFMREMGMDVPDSAVARADYISMVDNEILPLLRQTFGAQFTENEGKSLRATLGDPNASPREKDARLRSFIRTKMEDVNTQARALNRNEPFDQGSIDDFVANIGKRSPVRSNGSLNQLQQQFQQRKSQKYQNMSDDQLLELLK